MELPEFKGSTFRGAFGHTFRRLVCSQGDLDCAKCDLRLACVYAQVFDSFPPPDSEVLRKNADVPRPYVLEPPETARTVFERGEELTMGLVLVGRAVEWLPYFLITFRDVGERVGIGRGRGRYLMKEVHAEVANPGHGLELRQVYSATDRMVRPVGPNHGLSGLDSLWEKARPAHRVTLRFLTPARLQQDDHLVGEAPAFRTVVRTVLARTSSLLYFHEGVRLDLDFRGFLYQASTVTVADAHVQWVDWRRLSTRQKALMEMGGLVGNVTYDGDVGPFLPLLFLGQWLHLGKGTTFGLGRYEVVA